MTTVVVAGALAVKAGNSGNAWSRLAWVTGLRSLGLDCWLVEQLPATGAPDDAAEWFESVVAVHGLFSRSLLVDADGTVLRGPAIGLGDLVSQAALVLDISGHLSPEVLAHRGGPAVFLDDDPGFTQAWATAGDAATLAALDAHDLFLTYGTNIGQPDCPIPTLGRTWHSTVPPVAVDEWRVSASNPSAPFTTVGTWRGPFGSVEIDGTAYGLKVHEFRKLLALPQRVPASFELALDIHPDETADLERLRDHGWQVFEPASAVGTTCRYRHWIEQSAGEVSAAQGVYVGTRSGWVSDRTACYLAAGRPAIVQDTGLGRTLPVGTGLLAFADVDEAAAMVLEVQRDHEHHCRAARAIAREWFDAPRVAGALCELAGVPA